MSRWLLCYFLCIDTCRGDSGGPLMAITPSKQWELVGIVSYGRGCGNHEYSGGYTRVAAYEEFIQSVMNGTYIKPISRQCTCQCPHGDNQGVAYTSETSSEGCVSPCIASSASRCTRYNTYACLGTNCTYSSAYINSTLPVEMGRYSCSCQCPYGNDQGLAFTKRNSSEACVDACTAVLSNGCTEYNTYACLDTSCVYSSAYLNFTSSWGTGVHRCSCQCPYGNDQGVAYASTSSPQACVSACIGVLSNRCVSSNTYACLGTSCVYSAGYVNSTLPVMSGQYRCSCQCPYGSDQGFAYTSINSSQACVHACRAVLSNPCHNGNTYACLGTSCAYSPRYVNSAPSTTRDRFLCSCECPYGNDQGVAFAKENSTEACICACRAALTNICVGYNTYACLGTDCAYSSSYNYSLAAAPSIYRCACQCPYGNDQGVAYASTNSSQACVSACMSVSSNRCISSNTYVCLGTSCVYSTDYDNSTLSSVLDRYICLCHCPYGVYQGYVYATDNSSQACLDACTAVLSDDCTVSNTYACLGTSCVYSAGYVNSTSPVVSGQNRCSCQCPYGNDQGVAYASTSSPQACVSACIGVLSNRCVSSNTYACLGTSCVYSAGYADATLPVVSGQYQCSCQCPYGSDQGFAYTSINSSQACIDECRAVLSNPCHNGNTYACLSTDCAFSTSYMHKCSCQCPFGSNQSLAYTYGNTTDACVNACVAIPSNDCTSSNTYACLEDRCGYSSAYDNSSNATALRSQCSCQCPYGTDQGLAFTKQNSSQACVDACRAVPSYDCTWSNTFACLGTECAFSTSYMHKCSCQCPFGSNQSLAYTYGDTTDACVNACVAIPSNDCTSSNTYACLEDRCGYSSAYDNSSDATAVHLQCSCQCPYGTDQGLAFTKQNSSEACVDACRAVSSNPCHSGNTYACHGTSCAYSSGYVNSRLPVSSGQYRCSCQCPYGNDEGFAYASINSSQACVDACGAVLSNPCYSGNTYACVGTECAFSTSYMHKCSCQCPFGFNQSVTHTFGNTIDACVTACVAIPSNDCTSSNTYACLEDRCSYSSSYDNSSTTVSSRHRCVCHCPYDSYQGVALSKLNSTEACVNACIASPRNLCRNDNTYACLGSSCAYSNLYQYSSTTVLPRYRCSCQCPYGHDQGLAYASENSAQGCVDACQAILSNPCVSLNTYACRGTECMYSSAYSNSSVTARAGYQCVCQCPYGSDQGVAYAVENSASACVSACNAVPWNSCHSSNTYACRENDCAYSNSYTY